MKSSFMLFAVRNSGSDSAGALQRPGCCSRAVGRTVLTLFIAGLIGTGCQDSADAASRIAAHRVGTAANRGVHTIQSPQGTPAAPGKARPAGTSDGRPANPLATAKSWAYQLRGIDPDAIARSPYDVVVVDFADREQPFTAAEVERMRSKPDGSRRVVLAYLSIGEAERYRTYWQADWYARPPSWLGSENPEWKGNFPVRFWDPDWQKIILGSPDAYLDRIIAAGFDGTYLDRVDVHSNWETEKPDAERLMVAFVARLSAYAKAARPGFLVVPQNGEELLEHDDYLRVIDGVAKEDLLYGVDHAEKPNPPDTVTHSVGLLRKARRAGKPILVVEYLCERAQVTKVEQRIAKELGFLPYMAPRTLHSLGMGDEDYCLAPGPGGRRVALLLASSKYLAAPTIAAPAQDVRIMAAALRQAGFTDVRERIDLGRDSISQELQRFAETARNADWAVVYYAGLGMRVGETSYILPINARIEQAKDVDREAVPFEELETAVLPAKQVRLVFLDACRRNAFFDRMMSRGSSERMSPGMSAQLPRQPIAIGYASRCDTPHDEPVDKDPYTAALARHLVTPGLELPWLMERVRDSVLRMSRGAQQPVHLGALPDSAAFVAGPPEGR